MPNRRDCIQPRPRRGIDANRRSVTGKRGRQSGVARRSADDLNARRRSIVLNHRRRTPREPRSIVLSMPLRLVVIGRELDALEILFGESADL